MERSAINPSSWSVQLGFDQAELVEGHRRELVCSAQDAVDATGTPQHPATCPPNSGCHWTTSKRFSPVPT